MEYNYSHRSPYLGAGCVGVLIIAALVAMFWGWLLMLALGACGLEVGYWPAVFLAWVLSAICSIRITAS